MCSLKGTEGVAMQLETLLEEPAMPEVLLES